jgi:hypothetical protein
VDKKKRKYKTTAKQRAYGKKYYKKNKEKYKEYSKIGTAKRRSTVNKNLEVRQAKREAFTYSDLMKSRDDQTAKMVSQILSGERMLVT